MSTALDPTLIIIEEMDFKYTPPCEHSQHVVQGMHHEGPAYVLVRSICSKCEDSFHIYLCKRFWETVQKPGFRIRCQACGHISEWYEAYVFISYVDTRTR